MTDEQRKAIEDHPAFICWIEDRHMLAAYIDDDGNPQIAVYDGDGEPCGNTWDGDLLVVNGAVFEAYGFTPEEWEAWR